MSRQPGSPLDGPTVRDAYTGELSDRGLRDGFGCQVAFEGALTYHGQWSNGLPHGLGCLSTPSFVYYGQLRRGRIDGFGLMACRQGSTVSFVGQFGAQPGAPDGPGVVVFPDGTSGLPRQEGIFQGWRLVHQQLCPEAVRSGIRLSDRARDLAARAASRCKCDRSRDDGDTRLSKDFYDGVGGSAGESALNATPH